MYRTFQEWGYRNSIIGAAAGWVVGMSTYSHTHIDLHRVVEISPRHQAHVQHVYMVDRGTA